MAEPRQYNRLAVLEGMSAYYNVTGASGFIGRHLVKRLDESVTRTIPHGSIMDCASVPGSATFFLSGYGNLHSHTDAAEMIAANVVQPLRLLSVSTGKFVYVSTSSVTLPVQTPYSASKRAAEVALEAVGGERVVIARPYSVTGVGEQDCHLIPKLIRSCLDGELVSLCREPVHDFVDVEDFVAGLVRLADSGERGVFEFGSRTGTSNLDVLRLVKDVTGKRANIAMISHAREYDCDDWFCRSDKAERVLGWRAVKPLRESIAEMVAERRAKC